MVKCLPEFEYFTVFLKNRNFISKIKRSKVTDYAALNLMSLSMKLNLLFSKFAGSILPEDPFTSICMNVIFRIPYYYPDVFMRHSIATIMVL